ncbi:MAG: fused response regulator/phosphatase, partial [Motiliproteus sp.]|nr:fused response regulator/phosphatase [Motiliproteus sp.]
PDLILMDVEMPVMGGIRSVRRIKEIAGNRFVPVVFVTATNNEDTLSKCILAGGDDLIPKPLNAVLLRSKLIAIERNRAIYDEVEGLHSRMQRDQQIAEQVFNKAVLSGNIDFPGLQSLLLPASTFSGDVMLTALRPNGDLNLLLGDFTGHGLAASIGALPLSETFRAMTAKGYSGPEILQQIGRKLCNLLPTGMFLSAAYVSISYEANTVSIWNGGLPEIWLLNNQSKGIKQRFRSNHPPLGIFPPTAADIQLEVVDRMENESLLLCSDGVLEARNFDGELFGDYRYFNAVNEGLQARDTFTTLSQYLQRFCDDTPLDDDISLIEVSCSRPLSNNSSASSTLNSGSIENNQSWQWSMTLENRTLARVDPVPLAINQLQELLGSLTDTQSIFVVLTELYVNALDHGVLLLSSELKQSAAGFAKYFAEKEERMKSLKNGYIRLAMEFQYLSDRGELTIILEDSGQGFDYQPWLEQSENSGLSGRGLKLASSLCSSLNFEEDGRRVIATLEWPQ